MLSHFDRDNTIQHQDCDNRFTPDTDDITLIKTIAADSVGWNWITADLDQIRKNPAERIALAESKMNIVFFRSGFNGMKPKFQAVKLISAWDNIVYSCNTARQPTAFAVSAKQANEKIEVICPTRELVRVKSIR